jgi:hypothetical protein
MIMNTARVIPFIPDNAPLSFSISPDHPWLVQERTAFVPSSSGASSPFVLRDEGGMKRDEGATPGKSDLGEGWLIKLKHLVTHC